jgi:hypothetical protein
MVSGTKKLFIAILSVLFMFSLVFCVGSVPVKAETDYTSFKVIGAGIRVDDSKTIRFVTRIEKDVLDKIEGKVEVVTMITPERYLERAKINNEDGFKADANVQMNKVVFSEAKGNLKKVVEKVDETDDGIDNPIEYYHFNGCIYNVQEHNMSYPFAARSYITVDGGDPVAYTPYDVSGEDPVVTASLFEVAEKAIASGEYTGTDITLLEKYTKSYDVHFVSTDYADVTATVKHGYNLKDVAEIQHPCATITGFSGYDGEFITSQPAGDVTVNYSIEHNFADGACKDCGLTTPENFSFENSLSKDWAKVWVGECNLKDVTVNGKEMQKFTVSSKKNGKDHSGEYTRLKLIITESGYDYVYARFYTDTVYNPDTTLSLPRIRYCVAKKPDNATAYLFDENGTSVSFGTTQNLQEWYTLVINISDLTPSDENPVELWWDPDCGTSIGCSVYIADTMLVKRETEIPNNAEKTSFFVPGNATATLKNKLENYVITEYARPEGAASDTNRLCFNYSANASYLNLKLRVTESSIQTDGGLVGLNFVWAKYAPGYPSITAIWRDASGNITSSDSLKVGEWYDVTVNLLGAGGKAGNAFFLYTLTSTAKLTYQIKDAYCLLNYSDVVPTGTTEADVKNTGGGTMSNTVFEGEIVKKYSRTGSSGRLYVVYPENKTTLTMKLYIASSANATETNSGLTVTWNYYAAGTPELPISYVDSQGNFVKKNQLKVGEWYTITVDLTKVDSDASSNKHTMYLSGSDLEVYIKHAYYYCNYSEQPFNITKHNNVYSNLYTENGIRTIRQIVASGVSADTRVIELTFASVPSSLSMEFKFNVSKKDGVDATPSIAFWELISTYYDMQGNPVAAENLVVGTWYKVVVTPTATSTSFYTLGYSGAADIDVVITNITVTFPVA